MRGYAPMTKLKRKLTEAEATALQDYERISGYDLLHTDEYENGSITDHELLQANLDWFELLAAEVSRIQIQEPL